MYKVIFSDLDNTLLNADKKVGQKNKEAIKKAKEKGCKLIINTGRLPFCFEDFEKDIDTSDALSCDGCIVYSDSKIIYECYIDTEDALKILQYGIDKEEYVRLFCFDYLYIIHPEKSEGNSTMYEQSASIGNDEAIKVVKENKIYKIGFRSNHEHLEKIKKDLEALNLNVDILFSDVNFVECVKKGNNKGEGIKKYCEYNKIDINDTIGVGDNDNDRAMLETVGLACAPSNAIDEIKDICDYVTTANNDDGAICEIIEKYVI